MSDRPTPGHDEQNDLGYEARSAHPGAYGPSPDLDALRVALGEIDEQTNVTDWGLLADHMLRIREIARSALGPADEASGGER